MTAPSSLRCTWGLVFLLACTSLSAEIRHRTGRNGRLYSAYLEHRFEDSDAALNRARAEIPGGSVFLSLEQARGAWLRGELEQAVRHADDALRVDPDSLAALELKAQVLFRGAPDGDPGEHRRRTDEAIAIAETCVRKGTTELAIFDLLSQAHAWHAHRAERRGNARVQGEHRRQLRWVLQSWWDRMRDPRAGERLFRLAEELDDYEAQVPHLKNRLRSLSGEMRASGLLHLGRVLEQLGRREEAFIYLKEAFERPLEAGEQTEVSIRLLRSALSVGELELAVEAAQRALTVDPTNDLAVEGLADAYWALGKRREALRAWEQLARKASHRRAAVAEQALLWQYGVGRAREAQRDLEQLLARHDDWTDEELVILHRVGGRLHAELGQRQRAIARLFRARRHDPRDDDTTLLLATLLFDDGRRDEAIDLLDDHARDHPRPDVFRGLRANWDVARRRHREAVRNVRRFHQGASEPSEQARRAVPTAQVMAEAGRFEQAEDMLREALDQAPLPGVERALRHLLAEVQYLQGRPDEGKATLDELEEMLGRDAHVLESRAELEMRVRQRASAVKHAREALERIQKDGSGTEAELARFEELLGRTLMVDARPEEAIEVLRRAQRRLRHAPPGRTLLLARALLQDDRAQEALDLLEPALEQTPEAMLFLIEKGRCLLELGRKAEARQVLVDLVEVQRRSTSIIQRVSLALDRGGMSAAAWKVAEQAIASEPREAGHRLLVGMLADRAGRQDEAVAAFEKAIELAPHRADLYNSLGYTLVLHGRRLGEAVRLVKQALELRPGDGTYLDSLGWAYYRQGRLDEAEEALADAAARHPDPVILMHLGRIHEERGRHQEALEVYREALRLGLDEDEEGTRARVERLSGRAGALAGSLPGDDG
ncbi:MAG: tetratricopeptide repeat protein [Acidobacteriota bacterium]